MNQYNTSPSPLYCDIIMTLADSYMNKNGKRTFLSCFEVCFIYITMSCMIKILNLHTKRQKHWTDWLIFLSTSTERSGFNQCSLRFALQCHQWSRNCLPFRSTCVHPRFLVGFMLLDLQLYMYVWYVCRSLFVLLYVFFWSLCCLFFDIRILITPLVSSNSSFTRRRFTSSRRIQQMFIQEVNVQIVNLDKRQSIKSKRNRILIKKKGTTQISYGSETS